MYSTSVNTEKKLAAYRISSITIERLKTKARMENISVNTLVDNTLADLVKDIKSDFEIEESKKATEKFINEFAGLWSGPNYEGIEKDIFATRTIRKVVELI